MLGWVKTLWNRLTREPREPETSRISQGSRTMAGVAITPDTAITVAAVWACLRYLSQTVAVLPWRAMGEGERGAEIQTRNTVDWLLWKRPSPEWSSFQFRETLTHWALRYGNGYAEIERNDLGIPVALWPMHPDATSVLRETSPPYGLLYEFSVGGSDKVTLPARDVFHIRGFGENEVGLNVIAYAAESIGWSKAVQLFGAAFFGNGMQPAGIVVNKKTLTTKGLERQKAEMEEVHGGPRNKLKIAYLDGDADWKSTTLNARESQLIEVEAHLITEIARWFGVPPHKIMDLSRAHYSNVEHQSIEVVVDSVSPWVTRFQDEADHKLFGPQNRNGFWTEMDLRDLLKGDMKATMEYRRGMVMIGALSPNEIREEDGRNSLGKKGDLFVMQAQMTPLEKILEGPPKPAAPAAPAMPVDPDEDDPPMRELLGFADDPVDLSNADALLSALEARSPVDAA